MTQVAMREAEDRIRDIVVKVRNEINRINKTTEDSNDLDRLQVQSYLSHAEHILNQAVVWLFEYGHLNLKD